MKTSAQGRAMMLTAASRVTGAIVATVSGSRGLGAAVSGSVALAVWTAALAVWPFKLCETFGSLAVAFGSSVLGSTGCAGGVDSTAAGFAGAASTLGASAVRGACTGGAGFASSSRWLRAMTPVPTINVNARGATTNNLLLTARAPGQRCGLSFRIRGRRRLGRRIGWRGAGTGTVRFRLPGAELIA